MESGAISGNSERKINKYACACAVVGSMISIIFGYDTGVMSGAMIFIKEEFTIKEGQLEVLAGILNLCALVGSLCAGRTSDYIGRRYTIMLASIIFMLGSILMGYAPSYGVLLAGRCTAGIGVGFALMIAPVYAAEISSANTRGLLSSLPEIGISVGILLGYISNNVFARLSLKLGWRVMLGIAAAPSLFLAIGILKMPESPRWLVMQGRVGEAKNTLYKVCDDGEEAEHRLKEIKRAAGIDENCNSDVVEVSKLRKPAGEGEIWKELIFRPTPTVRWMLIAGVGVHFFEHATGTEAVILYGPRIFKKAGVTARRKLLLATVGVGLTKLTFITISTFIIDSVGRRKLLLFSIAGMVVALTGLATCLTATERAEEKLIWALVLSLIFVYMFIMFFNVGLCPVCWVYSSEIFPMKLRAAGASVCVAVNRVMNATISMSFLSLSAAITIGGAFYLFAAVAVLAWCFVYFCLPETKGRRLEEMEELFSKSSVYRKNEKKQLELVNNS
ncbi:putative transporter (major facilitator superfamily) [Handroanthus impetiginosus]|uniref:Putative transporter (Major facilitator superfamily) n=1 Tax=Handroanthus impetiginosus TaxID=429701 RepID=A0A2G9I307_9LAMI|nr:putative transporter (major facilitator superfamily) [Handroanthus impetiginosus]